MDRHTASPWDRTSGLPCPLGNTDPLKLPALPHGAFWRRRIEPHNRAFAFRPGCLPFSELPPRGERKVRYSLPEQSLCSTHGNDDPGFVPETPSSETNLGPRTAAGSLEVLQNTRRNHPESHPQRMPPKAPMDIMMRSEVSLEVISTLGKASALTFFLASICRERKRGTSLSP